MLWIFHTDDSVKLDVPLSYRDSSVDLEHYGVESPHCACFSAAFLLHRDGTERFRRRDGTVCAPTSTAPRVIFQVPVSLGGPGDARLEHREPIDN